MPYGSQSYPLLYIEYMAYIVICGMGAFVKDSNSHISVIVLLVDVQSLCGHHEVAVIYKDG